MFPSGVPLGVAAYVASIVGGPMLGQDGKRAILCRHIDSMQLSFSHPLMTVIYTLKRRVLDGVLRVLSTYVSLIAPSSLTGFASDGRSDFRWSGSSSGGVDSLDCGSLPPFKELWVRSKLFKHRT